MQQIYGDGRVCPPQPETCRGNRSKADTQIACGSSNYRGIESREHIGRPSAISDRSTVYVSTAVPPAACSEASSWEMVAWEGISPIDNVRIPVLTHLHDD